WLIADLMDRGYWPPIRFLKGVMLHPALRPDGSVLAVPGYDQATCLLYSPDPSLRVRIPENPSHEAAKKAPHYLLRIVQDFPFATAADQSTWLSGGLTILGRHAFEGPSPMHIYDATTPGTGKTLLAEITSLIVYGRLRGFYTAPSNDEEMRKV